MFTFKKYDCCFTIFGTILIILNYVSGSARECITRLVYVGEFFQRLKRGARITIICMYDGPRTQYQPSWF